MVKVTTSPDFENLKGVRNLNDEEFSQLEANVIADPKHERLPPVVIWKCGKEWLIVEGHNQYKLRMKNGLKVKFVKMEFAQRDDALRYAYDAQFGRRNLGPDERAIAAAEYAKLLPIGSAVETAKQGVSSKRSAIQQAAEASGSSERSTWRADKVLGKCADSVVEAVKDGSVSVSDAESIVDLPKRDQQAALSKVKRGESKTLRGASKPKKRKAGKPVFDYKKWDKKLGELIRLTDDHHKAYPDKKMLDVCLESLGTYQADFQAWRRSKKA